MRVVVMDTRNKVTPRSDDLIHISGRGNIGWSHQVMTLSFRVVHGGETGRALCHVCCVDLVLPLHGKSILLSKGRTVFYLDTMRYLGMCWFPYFGRARKVVCEGPQDDLIWIQQDDYGIFVQWLVGKAERILHPMACTERLIEILKVDFRFDPRIIRCEMQVKASGSHDFDLFLEESSERFCILVRTSRSYSCYIPLLSRLPGMIKEYIGLPILKG
mmetsp:Transcript_5654/g.7918  ORF Transcript_5654/g.7918 Transcript_5654/m.7918 type:complete len:216 (+) Transcript_5654:1811-2458(+)